MPFTLDPRLLWDAHTHGAPWRTLLARRRTSRTRSSSRRSRIWTPKAATPAEEWLLMYVHALGVLPLFDAGSIPNSLIVDGRRRCFLVRALAHPDDRVSQAAAHALQRVVIHHAQLRVKVRRALLALVGRIRPPTSPCTVLGHFTS